MKEEREREAKREGRYEVWKEGMEGRERRRKGRKKKGRREGKRKERKGGRVRGKKVWNKERKE